MDHGLWTTLSPLCLLTSEIVDGMPRWRLVLAYWTQLACIPMLLLAYALGADWAIESFILVFSIYMLQDFAWFPKLLTPLMVLHHVACLLGLAVSSPGDAAACTAGSPLCSLDRLRWPASRPASTGAVSSRTSSRRRRRSRWAARRATSTG